MNKNLIKRNTQIAIGLLASTVPNRYGNGKVNHAHRTYITQTVAELLEMILEEVEENDDVIIPNNSDSINPSDES